MTSRTRTGSHGATTHPDAETGAAGGASRRVGVRWVFPTPWTAPLPDNAVLGRDADCTIVLPGNDVSRRHAEIRGPGLLPSVRDLGSRNGTWVNGVKVDERTLGPDDVLRIGEWVGLVAELRPGEVGQPSVGLMELASVGDGWFGGATLANAIDPARRVAGSDLPVIVQGETGTGKEGIAKAVHAWSGRRGAFIAVNCAAIQAALAEGELFGYRKGAFTGADRANEGFFRAANGGTIFLDEILELPAQVQSKLLRALEQGEVQPLGEARPVTVDVRVICATQEPLARAVAEKRFRPDLLARLDGVTITLPPLRERREDIAPLFLRLLHDLEAKSERRAARAIDSKLIEALLLYDWPLNIRELVLLARRMLAMHGGEPALKRAMLPSRMIDAKGENAGVLPAGPLVAAGAEPRASAAPPAPVAPRAARASSPSSPSFPASSPPTPGRPPKGDEVAFDQFLLALRAARGNVSRAAASLGISRARAYRLLEARPEVDVRSLRDENER